jgi:hypothetical protein
MGGTTMIASVKTSPNVAVAFSATYSEDSYFPDWHWVPRDANTDGNVIWSWEITPAHPRGSAKLTVVAGNAEGGGTEQIAFRVATVC